MIRLLAALLFIATPALAEEISYSPAPCDFAITFPQEPVISQNCDNQGVCYELALYGETFDSHKHRLTISATCSAVTPDIAKRYDEELMAATIRAMARRAKVSEFEVTHRVENTYRQSGLVGAAQNPGLPPEPKIFIAQLWVGENSALSVEAELIGKNNPAADEVFANILKSVGLKAP